MLRRLNAPFKPPRPLGTNTATQVSAPASSTPLAKKSPLCGVSPDRVSVDAKPLSGDRRLKRPKIVVDRSVNAATCGSLQPCAPLDAFSRRYYTVQWRKRTNKKNKLWEGDGYIVVSENGIVLKTQARNRLYKPVGRTNKTATDGLIVFGTYEAEVDCEASLEEIQRLTSTEQSSQSSSAPENPETVAVVNKPMKRHRQTLPEPKRLFCDIPSSPEKISEPLDTLESVDIPKSVVLPNSVVVANSPVEFSLPLVGNTERRIIVDERLLYKLRPHQREAVIFIYECLVGIRDPQHLGALLADEMGLGKTLTAIAVIWTLLKQSPCPNQPPLVAKVLICCPVTLIENWRREFSKWLDVNRIGILALNGKQQTAAKDKRDIVSFGKTKVYQVLIMSYEKVMSCSKELAAVKIDMVVCDEGHRLKNAANKTLNILGSLGIPRKLLLTGTPIQNDLNEYYTIINFINPGILGTFAEFQREFSRPIIKAREKSCVLREALREGRRKSAELISTTKAFVLRRTKDSIRNFLTDRTDVLIFCRPTKWQRSLYQLAVSSSKFSSFLGSEQGVVLALINLFKKICNLPALVEEDALYQQLYQNSNKPAELAPAALKKRTAGSKINVLVPLLLEFRAAGEKTVLISNYTQTLDYLEQMLSKLNLRFLRLDGATSANTRDQLVTKFNRSPHFDVFILSAKAGGVGLNLIGASRLVLFDNDWNPLVDQQALGRIHRDGQKRPVFIYRLFTAGAIDEKIFQRQLTKLTLSDMFLDDLRDSNLSIFDSDDLRDLFTVNDTACNTHDLLCCECNGTGNNLAQAVDDAEDTQEDPLLSTGFSSALDLMEDDEKELAKRKAQPFRTALNKFRHYDPARGTHTTGDAVLDRLMSRSGEDITYCFTHTQASERA